MIAPSGAINLMLLMPRGARPDCPKPVRGVLTRSDSPKPVRNQSGKTILACVLEIGMLKTGLGAHQSEGGSPVRIVRNQSETSPETSEGLQLLISAPRPQKTCKPRFGPTSPNSPETGRLVRKPAFQPRTSPETPGFSRTGGQVCYVSFYAFF